jgi:hypothetical protein
MCLGVIPGAPKCTDAEIERARGCAGPICFPRLPRSLDLKACPGDDAGGGAMWTLMWTLIEGGLTMPRLGSPKLLALLALPLLLFLAGCGEEEVVEIEKEPAIRVTVAASEDSIDGGAKVTAIATVTAENVGALTYAWSATGGSFTKASAETTVWIAPEDPSVYTLSCVVTDGNDAGIGTDRVWVGPYVPADHPFYIGAATCAICHSEDDDPERDQYLTWSQTAHAGAVETLRDIGMGNNSYCLQCHTVGSYGLYADASLNNGGYDEMAVARLEGVQCENCHGPASNHTENDEEKYDDLASVGVSISDTVCGRCHTDEHHPTWDEWQEGPHSSVVEDAALNTRCVKCHNGLFAVRYLDNPPAFTNPTTAPTESRPHTCAVCHDPHGSDNPGQLRDAAAMDVALPNSPLIPSAGAGRLCMSCHNGRRTETDVGNQINDGSDHFGPHHSNQGDMLAGVNGYEDVAPDFAFASSKHILVQDACITCHVKRVEAELPYFTGHTFEPTTSACTGCHGSLATFEDVIAKQDFDGDGTVEGVQQEIGGLLDTLRVAIIDASATDTARQALEEAEEFSEPLGDPDVTTPDQREAGYNWAFVSYDGSKGVHNATYSVQLLQRSILFLDTGKLANAHLLVE